MAKKRATYWEPIRPYESAQRTLEALDALIEKAAEAGVTPSAEVTQCRADLADITLAEAQIAAEIEQVGESRALATEDALGILSRDRDTTTPDDRVAALTKVLGTHPPQTLRDLKRMQNQNQHRHARDAARRWHHLGDGLITGLLQPWGDAITNELEPLVEHVIAGGHEGMVNAEIFAHEYQLHAEDISRWQDQPTRYHEAYRRLRAAELVHQYRHLAENITHELRNKGLLETLHPEGEIPLSALIFQNPAVLPPITHIDTRPTEWFADAIASGAQPRLRTAEEAARTHKPEASMATT